MKKKNLLQDWEIAHREYYEQFNRSQIARLYGEWFGNNIDHYPYMEKYQMIDELIHRQEDSIEDLIDTIKHLNKLIISK